MSHPLTTTTSKNPSLLQNENYNLKLLNILIGFTQAANLRNHERIHTNQRPYSCIDCGKAFTQITNLNNHRRLHTGGKLYAKAVVSFDSVLPCFAIFV